MSVMRWVLSAVLAVAAVTVPASAQARHRRPYPHMAAVVAMSMRIADRQWAGAGGCDPSAIRVFWGQHTPVAPSQSAVALLAGAPSEPLVAGRSFFASCQMWVRTRLGGFATCIAVVHERGHLAGFDHTDGPGRHPDDPAGLMVMRETLAFYAPCRRVQHAFRYVRYDDKPQPAR